MRDASAGVTGLQLCVDFASIGRGAFGFASVGRSAARDGENAPEEIAALDWRGPSAAQCDSLLASCHRHVRHCCQRVGCGERVVIEGDGFAACCVKLRFCAPGVVVCEDGVIVIGTRAIVAPRRLWRACCY